MDQRYGFDLKNPKIIDCLFKNISSKYTFPEYTSLGLFSIIPNYKDYKVIDEYDNFMKSLNKICSV